MQLLRKFAQLSFVAVVSVLPAQHLAAQEKGGACKADIEKFCKDVKPGGGRVAQCLKPHANELSSDCKTAIENAKSSRAGKAK